MKIPCALAALAVLVLISVRPPADVAAAVPSTRVGDPLAKIPFAFVENRGQWEASTKFAARRAGMTLQVEEAGFKLHLARHEDEDRVHGVVVRIAFEGARDTAVLEGAEPLPGTYNFFLGNNPARWRTNVPAYASVLCRGVQAGVDLRLRESTGTLEYDLILQPGADLDRVVMHCEGAEGIEVEPDGSLTMATALGPIRQTPPVTWQVTDGGERLPVEARFRRLGPDRYGFEVAERDASLALVIDPGLLYSTFIGGFGLDTANAMALDAAGGAIVAGYTDGSPGFLPFPTTAGAFDTTFNGFIDAFVLRLSPSGANLVYATYLGSTGDDRANAVALDASGAATVVGYTSSSGFPTTAGAYDTSHNGSSDAFVARLSPDGSSLQYSTFLGANGGEQATGVALDSSGRVVVVGWTQSATFPITVTAYDGTYNGGFNDAFVAYLSSSGSNLLYSTFLGGTGDEVAWGVAVNSVGIATVVGETGSFDFPPFPPGPGWYQGGARDAFVVRMSSGGNLVNSALLGGTGVEVAYGVAVDPFGVAAVVGSTNSADFPTTAGAYDRTFNGVFDAFVARVSALGTLMTSTFLGGSGQDALYAAALDTSGAVTVTGTAGSNDFPTTPGAFLRGNGGGAQPIGLAIVTRLSASMAGLLYSTYIGLGEPRGIALDGTGAATLAGFTGSSSFPTTAGAFDRSHNGGNDIFVTRLDLLPTGVTAYGASTPGCGGAIAIGVDSTPQWGNSAFAITCTNAPSNAAGVIILAGGALSSPLPLLGAMLWLNPASAFFAVASAQANAVGASTFSLPLPPDPSLIGQRVDAQFFWGGPNSPPPCPPLGVSASNALAIVIQP